MRLSLRTLPGRRNYLKPAIQQCRCRQSGEAARQPWCVAIDNDAQLIVIEVVRSDEAPCRKQR